MKEKEESKRGQYWYFSRMIHSINIKLSFGIKRGWYYININKVFLYIKIDIDIDIALDFDSIYKRIRRWRD